MTKEDQERAVLFAELYLGPCKSKKQKKELLEWAKYVDKELDKW